VGIENRFLEEVCELLDGVFNLESEDQRYAACPAHADEKASLSIATGESGNLLFTCHANCEYEAIERALLERARSAHPVATYRYLDADRKVVLTVTRRPLKQFTRFPAGVKQLPPYNYPELLAADKEQTILVVEGEKDADNLSELGLLATTTGGASGWRKLSRQYLDAFKDRDIVVIPDRDTPGQQGAEYALDWLVGLAKRVRVLQLPYELEQKHGKDISDWLKERDDDELEELDALIEKAVDAAQFKPEKTAGWWKTNHKGGKNAGGKHRYPQGEGPYVRLAQFLKDETDFAVDRGGRLYVYQDGVYAEGGKEYVCQRVQELTREIGMTWRPGYNEGVATYIANEAPHLWDWPPVDVISVQNGLLNLATRELRPHDPSYLSTVQLPVEYDPSIEPQAWPKFIAEVFPEDARDWGYIIPMWLLTVSREVQKAGLLKGEPGCGKSTYADALITFLGQTNVCNKALQQLAEDRFSKAALVGKLANIKTELPGRTLRELDTFTSLVTFDPQDAERKHEHAFSFNPFAKLLFSTNDAPPVTEAGAIDAYADRWFVVPFPRRFRGTAAERGQGELLSGLTAPRELSGLLNKVLEQYAFVKRTRLHRESWPPSMQTAYAGFMQETVKLTVWLQHALEYTGEESDRITKQELYDLFMQYGKGGVLSQKRFFSEVKHALPELDNAARYVKLPPTSPRLTKQAWAYVGWRIRAEYFAFSL
jgi:putative DNA primase/helicase